MSTYREPFSYEDANEPDGARNRVRNDRTSSGNNRIVFSFDGDVPVHRHQGQKENRHDEIHVCRCVRNFTHGRTK